MAVTSGPPEAGRYGLWQVSVEAPPNTWIEQETGDVIIRVAARDCASRHCPHDAHTLTATQVPTCAHGKHTQQHVMLVLCGGDVVGKLWTGKAQSRKALREDRVGLGGLRRITAHRPPDESTSERHPSGRLREREREAAHLPPCVRGDRGRASVSVTERCMCYQGKSL